MLLAHLMVDTMIDRVLAIREPMAKLLTTLQDDLLDPRTSSTDWRVLLENRKQVRRLEAMSESQLEALDAWRRGSVFDWNRAMDVRVRDRSEEHTSELQSLMRISYAVFGLKKKNIILKIKSNN